MEILESNLAALQKRFSSFNWRAVLSQAQLHKGARIEQARNGELTMFWHNGYVHSAYNPQKEAQTAAAALDDESDSFIFLGFGLGFSVKAARQRFPQKPFFLVEPSLGLFAFILQSVDLSDLILDKNCHFFIETQPSEIVPLLRSLNLSKPQTQILRSLANVPERQAFYRELHEELKGYKLRKKAGDNTVERFGFLWMRNLARNLPLLPAAGAVNDLKNIFQGLPALLIAAGPSLDEALPIIGQLRDKAVLVCVDTALRALLRHGIEPDFTVAVDSQYWNSRHLDNCVSPRTVFVAEPSLSPRALRPQNAFVRYFCSSLFPLGKEIEKETREFGVLRSGGSVATTAWDLCCFLGASSIWCAGLDLGFPQGKTHVKGSLFEERALIEANRLLNAQTIMFEAGRDANPFLYPAARGGFVYTDQRLAIYRLWFEEALRDCNIPCYNLSNGVAIKGMELSDAESLLKLPAVRRKIDLLMEQARCLKRNVAKESQRMREAQKNLISQFLELQKLSQSAVKENRKLIMYHRSQSGQSAVLKKLNSIDQAILRHKGKETAGFLLEPFINEFVISQKNAKTALEGIKAAEAFYLKLAEQSLFYKDLLESVDLNL